MLISVAKIPGSGIGITSPRNGSKVFLEIATCGYQEEEFILVKSAVNPAISTLFSENGILPPFRAIVSAFEKFPKKIIGTPGIFQFAMRKERMRMLLRLKKYPPKEAE